MLSAGITNVNVTNIVGVVQSNPNWQVMQSTSQTAVAGNNYLTTNSALSTLTLPASPGIGSIISFAGSGANGDLAAHVVGAVADQHRPGDGAGAVQR